MSEEKRLTLIEKIRLVLRDNRYSEKTSQIYIGWIRRYILFHNKIHPLQLGPRDVGNFLNYLVNEKKVSYATQKQALSSINFLYEAVLGREIGLIDNFVWGRMPIKRNYIVSKRISLKSDKNELKVFLCHALEDKKVVRDLYSRLIQNGVKPWLDEQDIIAGQDWEYEIEKSVSESDAVIVCLSKRSITKTGYVQKEIKYALDIADKQPEGAIFIIPFFIEKCALPRRLQKWQAIEFYHKDGYNKLLEALDLRAESL